MGATSDAAIRTGAAEFLHPSEDVIATLVVSVRGHQQKRAGGVAGIIGGARAGRARKAAEGAGIELASPMALVLTSCRLLTFETGRRGNVKAMLNELVLQEVGGLEVRRVGLGASLTLTLRDTSIALESRVGASRDFAEVLAQARAAVA
jgi:hypothetical protein